MLRSVKELVGYDLSATDGSIGKVKDFLFDDVQWTLRWMVADTGGWLSARKVLISPISLGEPNWISRIFPVHMTKDEIEKAPGLHTDEPVSKEYETAFFNQYGWGYYWGGADAWSAPGVWGGINASGVPSVWGGAPNPVALFSRQEEAVKAAGDPESRSHVLRSVDEVIDYRIQALDDEIGHVEDFIVDDESWMLRYMIVDTRNWLPGRKVLIATDWITDIDWADRKVSVDLTRDAIKGSPEYKASALANREYENNLYDYYGRPVFWKR